MRSLLFQLLALLVLCNLCACQTTRTRSGTTQSSDATNRGKKTIDLPMRNNAWALLHDLLNEEKHLSKILIIKRESSELNRLVKNISEVADRGADRLKALAKHESGVDLAATALPPGEKATRESIGKMKQHLLLHSKGAEFEFQLLLTQSEALSYGTHLALVAAENEPQPARAQEFSALSAQLKSLHEQVLAMLRSRR
ncbi:MAG TPA: hypothetical protein VK530_05030 [Candidatus Acidoferrum sp.]|nr:hypothetical protein [Candidatus Acidoferrum sp.]